MKNTNPALEKARSKQKKHIKITLSKELYDVVESRAAIEKLPVAVMCRKLILDCCECWEINVENKRAYQERLIV